MNGPQIALLAVFGLAMLVMGAIAGVWLLALLSSCRQRRRAEIYQMLQDRIKSMSVEDWQKVMAHNVLWKKMQEQNKSTCTQSNVESK